MDEVTTGMEEVDNGEKTLLAHGSCFVQQCIEKLTLVQTRKGESRKTFRANVLLYFSAALDNDLKTGTKKKNNLLMTFFCHRWCVGHKYPNRFIFLAGSQWFSKVDYFSAMKPFDN